MTPQKSHDFRKKVGNVFVLTEHLVAYANVYKWLNLIYSSSWSCVFTSRMSAAKWLSLLEVQRRERERLHLHATCNKNPATFLFLQTFLLLLLLMLPLLLLLLLWLWLLLLLRKNNKDTKIIIVAIISFLIFTPFASEHFSVICNFLKRFRAASYIVLTNIIRGIH